MQYAMHMLKVNLSFTILRLEHFVIHLPSSVVEDLFVIMQIVEDSSTCPI